MDPAMNPFRPGAGLRPPELVGRDRQIDGFDLLVARSKLGSFDRSMVFYGLRGVVKTSLMTYLRDHAINHGWVCFH